MQDKLTVCKLTFFLALVKAMIAKIDNQLTSKVLVVNKL